MFLNVVFIELQEGQESTCASRTDRTRWSGLGKVGLTSCAFALVVAGCHGPDDAEVLDVPDEPTFSSHVAEILYQECSPCHQAGGPASFPLQSYDDARVRAETIARVTGERQMPPWLPEPGDYPFVDERRLSDREIAILQRWSELGAPEGDPAAAPTPPEPADGWVLGPPDLILEMSEAYTVPAIEPDEHRAARRHDLFRNFVIPVPVDETKHVRAAEFQPDDARVVHHAIMSVDPTTSSRQEDAGDPEPGFDGMFSSSAARPPAGFVLGWTPGGVPQWNPDGLTWPLEPGTDFVIQTHFRPLNEPVKVRLRVGLHFREQAPERGPLVRNLYLLGPTVDIPAGDSDYTVEDSFVLPVDMEILGLYPHAHYLARTMDLRAALPDGEERTLLRIKEWDFDWQQMYAFESPVALPAGTELRMRYVYDNSTDNPRNPHDPPQRVTLGRASTDEMAELWIQARPRNQSEFAVLQEAVNRKAGSDHVELWRHLAQLNPDDALAHANLASMYAAQGQIDPGIEHYRRALEIRPDFELTHYNLAVLLQDRGELSEAMHHYREAVRTFPEYSAAHFDLGNLLFHENRLEEAEQHYRRAIEIDPQHAEAHLNLGNLARERGQIQEALDHYRRAAEAAPGSPQVHFMLGFNLILLGLPDEAVEHLHEGARLAPQNLPPRIAAAWMLATHPDASVRRPEQAIHLAEELYGALGKDHPLVLDLLAAAHAAAGRFDQALVLAQGAHERASAMGEEELARRIGERLGLYRQGRRSIGLPQ